MSLADIYFRIDQTNSLRVTIDTDRLRMRSVEAKEEDYRNYAGLFGDPEVMAKYSNGRPKVKEDIITRIRDTWAKRWDQNNPYSGLSVHNKETNEFLGHVVLGYGDAPGHSEIAYLFRKEHWGMGYGSETVTAVVKEYAPATIKKGYALRGKPLEKITATVRHDNPASERILKRIGMQKIGEERKYGALRYFYSIDIL